jgi:outer membrane receptor protein involved in Fe transport
MGVSAAAILGMAAPAYAQDTTSDSGTTVGEVVVTAQKREEAIQDVPIAVSAFTQDTLEKAKIDGGPNLVIAIPNVSFSKGNFTGYNFQIRGVGSQLVAASGDAGTGIHLNNVPLTANNLFEAEFYDVERVEVLRGPQGTLYGRNATGGVVNIITAKPVQDFEAAIRVEAGNYNSRKVRGMVNVPLGEMFAVRLAGSYLARDGYGENTATGNDVDDRDLYGYRATLAFTPTDTFTATLMADVFDEDDNRSRIGKQFCTKDPGPANVGGVAYDADFGGLIGQVQRGFFSQGCQETSLYSPGALGTVNSQATLGGLFASLTGLQTGDANVGKMQDPDVRNIESYFDPVYQAHTDIYTFNIAWDLTDSLQLTSLSSFSENEIYTRQDYTRSSAATNFNATPNPVNAFGGPLAAAYVAGAQAQTCAGLVGPALAGCNAAVAANPGVQAAAAALYPGIYAGLFPGGVVDDPQIGPRNQFTTIDISSGEAEQFSQELRLQSNFAGPINFNFGGIYLDYKTETDYFVMFNTGTAYVQVNNFIANFASGGAVPYPCPEDNLNCVYIDPNSDPDRSGHNYYDNYTNYHLKSRAAFGEVYYEATDALKFTMGLRYTHDRKLVENHPVGLTEPGSGLLEDPAEPILLADFKETTGRIGFDWKPVLGFTDETMFYAFLSKGYKGGGVNPACSFSCATYPATFAPEFVNAIELGAKNTLLNGSMMLNATVFHYDYEGYQVSKIVNRTSINENIDAKIKGAELETVWSPVRGLRFNANIGWLDTEITGGESIDTFNRTQGDPDFIVAKSSNASNCVVPLAVAQGYLTASNTANNPFILLGLCDDALAFDGFAVDLEGNKLPGAADWTLSLGAEYTMEFGSGWFATARADYYKQTETFARIYNSDADKIQGWENVNATLTVANDAMGLSVEAFVKNATDEEAITGSYLTDDSSGLFRNAFFTEPRTYGVAVSKRF